MLLNKKLAPITTEVDHFHPYAPLIGKLWQVLLHPEDGTLHHVVFLSSLSYFLSREGENL